ncbi:methyltransferase [Campylobacter sp. MIT 12-5580]|uniref:TylF/MycF/NovP-related O-methyltransferase n=1 Tax=Campylobacter sp. MIT 12-5580 TaxID=2040651 RepID=UPI0010F8A8CD|nr:TylF/MycF/NovP-related O-methyltransferase [Campylobacter sp. MIT 12-5580]TKX28194.1 methyltransferase [Campylobacter sp. MIT 12-5580]
MKKVVIYGSAQLGIQIAWHVSFDSEIICFIDSDPRKHSCNNNGLGLKIYNRDYLIYGPEKLKELEFDKVFIGTEIPIYIDQIIEVLKSMNINEDKIDLSLTFIPYYARLNFIKTLSDNFKTNNIQGAVAELGVFRGDTAKHINKFFKDSIFYLLDTFEGFDARDCENEKKQGFSKADSSDFSLTSLELVKAKMPHLENCRFIKGYFPESAEQIPSDEEFCFVNIDVDLYQPILAGLEYFYPRLVRGGIILVHDYFHPYYTGTQKAVNEFGKKYKLKFYPIGDAFSVFFVKE